METIKILLVDDENESRTSVAEFLRELGHQVIECGDGSCALTAFCEQEFHMVLTDIKMPGMSGLELLRAIRSSPGGAEVDVVLFTGYGDMETAIQALRAGAYDYLLKPINIEELVQVTERIGEHQHLRKENEVLTRRFSVAVQEATEETRRELLRLQEAYRRIIGLGRIGVFSRAMKEVFRQAQKLHADRSIPVLIEGETGTGKEVVARYIHYGEGEVTAPFIDINCAALTPTIFESELFGYEGGAFTGGLTRGQRGKMDLAEGGTLFLDEIAEIPVDLQAKLLRVIQEKEFYRVGGLKKIKIDVRIICSTNVNLEQECQEGSFRQDLYYRLNVGRIYIPPLRERVDDILPLATMFLDELAREKGTHFRSISDEAAGMLRSYSWPGNVRELKNAMEWVALMWDDTELKPCHLGILEGTRKDHVPGPVLASGPVLDYRNYTLPPDSLPLEELTNNIIRKALQMHRGNKTRTAKYLGISRRSLYCRLKHL